MTDQTKALAPNVVHAMEAKYIGWDKGNDDFTYVVNMNLSKIEERVINSAITNQLINKTS